MIEDFMLFFESDYAGFEAVREKLILPVFGAKVKEANLNLEVSGQDKSIVVGMKIFASISGVFKVNFVDVTINDNVVIERNKVAVQRCVRRIIENHSSALIFFHYKDKKKKTWRVTFVNVGESAKSSSNPKRYTYLCGRAHHARTIAERFEILRNAEHITDENLLAAFSVETLTKEFYSKLFAWYEWALKESNFPEDNEISERKEDKIIRLITRLIFVWFIKQKNLVPNELFDTKSLSKILKNFNKTSEKDSVYYNAILQNLFFATLNREIKDEEGNARGFACLKNQRDLKTFYRYEEMFCLDENENKNKEKIIQLFSEIPFLNGGLFECLDKEEKTDKVKFHFDGFSRNSTKKNGKFTQRAFVPNCLFFDENKGIIPLFNLYNFTVEENTPSDIQVALDPELLGKVFENLLGVYNPETQESARKDSGSFYTPREIVEYMVNESLVQYLCNKIDFLDKDKAESFVNNADMENAEEFSLDESKEIIQSLYDVKVFDPACGSGAFPMGMLNKLESLIITLSKHCTQLVKNKESINSDNSITINEGQSIYYEPDENLKIQCRYLGNFEFEVLKNEEVIKEKIKVDDMTLLVKGEIEKYNHGEKHKKTIANIFSQGRIENNTSFINIGQKKKLSRIIDDKNNVIWEYKTYNTKNNRSFAEDTVYNIIYSNRTTDKNHYNLKLTLIQNCIYGSDIQPIAVQIAKLRFFISLICEQEKDETQENFGISPLPNLETKIVCANTLIGLEKKGDVLSNNEIDKTQDELKKVRQSHFAPQTMHEKKALRKKDLELRNRLSELLAEDGFYNRKDAMQMAEWNPYSQWESCPFFDAEWMFGIKDGFDIVIGNPPYIQLQKNGGELGNLYQDKNYKTFTKTGDIYSLFYERGIRLLKQNAHLCFITSNKWMRAGYGESTRKFFAENNPVKLIDFAGVKIFDNATVDTNILLIQKCGNKNLTECCIAKDKSCRENLCVYVQQNFTKCDFNNSDSWVILSPIEQSIKLKIEKVGTPLKDWDIQINYGIKTGFNEAFIIDTKKRNEILTNCKTEDERSKTDEIIRPILRGRDIKRYGYNWADLWLINTHNGIKEKNILPIDIKDYPAIKEHLDKYWDRISQRDDKGVTPYNLRNCTYMDDFFQQKMVWKRVGSILKFAFDDTGKMALDSTCFAVGKHIKFLTCLFNSKMGNYLLQEAPKTGTGDLLISVQAIEPLKIPMPNKNTEKEFSKLLDGLLTKKSKEKEIDLNRKIYELYELDKKEINFIEKTI